MKNTIKKVVMGAALLSLVACNGGNGGGSSSGGSNGGALTHNQLADSFVKNLNLDSEFDVELVKSSTLQYDYVVIYDPMYGSYDAIDISSYNPSYDNAADYYASHTGAMVTDLNRVSGHYEYSYDYVYAGIDQYGYDIYNEVETSSWVPTRYHDYGSGLVFEKTAASTKDLAKVVAVVEAAQQVKTAEYLSEQFGLSMSRGKDIAKLSAHWAKASKKGMTDADQDKFSEELLGFSIGKAKSAYKKSLQGDLNSIDELIKQSAKVNKITPEHAKKLMQELFKL